MSCHSFLHGKWPSWHTSETFLIWLLLFFPCFFQEFPSIAWMLVVLVLTILVLVALHEIIHILFKKSKHHIKLNHTLQDGSSLIHILVGINIPRTYWHISQIYPFSRVFIFFILSSESLCRSRRFPTQIFFVFWMLISFIMVAYLAISSFLTHSISQSF